MAVSLLFCLQGPGRAGGGWGSPRQEAHGCHLPADQQGTAHPTDGALPPREGPLTAQCRQAAWQGSGHPQLEACGSTSGPLSREIRADLHGAGAAPAALAYVLSLQPHQHQVTPTFLKNQLLPVPGKQLGLRHPGEVVLRHEFRRWACCVTSGESRPSEPEFPLCGKIWIFSLDFLPLDTWQLDGCGAWGWDELGKGVGSLCLHAEFCLLPALPHPGICSSRSESHEGIL